MSTIDMTMEQMYASTTGGERSMIARRYKRTLTQLADDVKKDVDHFAYIEALIFIHLCRTGLGPDKAAEQAQGMSLTEFGAYFAPPEREEIDYDAESTAAREMAEWCYSTGRSVAEWRTLDTIERQAFSDVIDEIRATK